MSIFGRKNSYATNDVVVEGYNCENNGDLIAIQEGYEDQLAIIEALHAVDAEELAYRRDVLALESAGASVKEIENRREEFFVVTEGAVSNVYEKIKAFLNKIKAKLKAFFASVVRYFDGLFKSGKDFATKYEKELRKLNLSGFEYKMFKYENLDGSTPAEALEKAQSMNDRLFNNITTKDEVENVDDKKDDEFDKFRGELIGSSAIDAADFSQELFSHFRSDATDKSDMEEVKVQIGTIIDTLKTNKDLQTAEKALSKVDSVFDKAIRAIEKSEKEHDKVMVNKTATEEEKTKAIFDAAVCQKKASHLNEAKTIALEYFRAWKSAVTERNSVYKNVCVAAFRYKKEK